MSSALPPSLSHTHTFALGDVASRTGALVCAPDVLISCSPSVCVVLDSLSLASTSSRPCSCALTPSLSSPPNSAAFLERLFFSRRACAPSTRMSPSPCARVCVCVCACVYVCASCRISLFSLVCTYSSSCAWSESPEARLRNTKQKGISSTSRTLIDGAQGWERWAGEKVRVVVVASRLLLLFSYSSHSRLSYPPRPQRPRGLNAATHRKGRLSSCFCFTMGVPRCGFLSHDRTFTARMQGLGGRDALYTARLSMRASRVESLVKSSPSTDACLSV